MCWVFFFYHFSPPSFASFEQSVEALSIVLCFVLASPDRSLISMLMLPFFPFECTDFGAVLCCPSPLEMNGRRSQISGTDSHHSSFEYTRCCVLQRVSVSYVLLQSQHHSKATLNNSAITANKTDEGPQESIVCETSITVGLETISIHLAAFDLRKWESTAMLHVLYLFLHVCCLLPSQLTDVLFSPEPCLACCSSSFHSIQSLECDSSAVTSSSDLILPDC